MSDSSQNNPMQQFAGTVRIIGLSVAAFGLSLAGLQLRDAKDDLNRLMQSADQLDSLEKRVDALGGDKRDGDYLQSRQDIFGNVETLRPPAADTTHQTSLPQPR